MVILCSNIATVATNHKETKAKRILILFTPVCIGWATQMLFCVIARITDWEHSSKLGYVSSVSRHGSLFTYANNFNSYLNDTASGNVTVLFRSDQPNLVLVAVYDDVQVTYSASDRSVRSYMSYTWVNNITSVRETVWQEVDGVRLKNANARALNIYKDIVAYEQSSSVLFYKYRREENSYGEHIPVSAVQMGEAPANMWQFVSIEYDGIQTPFIIFCEASDGYIYAINTTSEVPKTVPIHIPELVDMGNITLLYCNSSEATDTILFRTQNDTVVSVLLSFDMEEMEFRYAILSALDVVREVLPRSGLSDIQKYNNITLYSMQHVIIFATDYLAVFPLIADQFAFYMSNYQLEDQYTVDLVRLADKNIFQLYVDKAPGYVQSDGYSTLYLMGTQDRTISGYFAVDLNGLLVSHPGERLSCWTIPSRLNVAYDPGNLRIAVSLLNSENCIVVPPQAIAYNGFGNSQPMERETHPDGNGGEIVHFSVSLVLPPQSTYELQVKGAVGKDEKGMLISDVVLGQPAQDDSAQSCWMFAEALALTFDNNLLTVVVSRELGCSLDQPIVTAAPLTPAAQQVELKFVGTPSPSEDERYYFFFDPARETFSNDVTVEFYIQLVSPSGQRVGGKMKAASKSVNCKMPSCWNIMEYRGMSYNYDHFELLRWDEIWANRTAQICEPRATFDGLEVTFSYRTNKKITLTLSEDDFVQLDNGRMAYYIDIDMYDDWVSPTARFASGNKGRPVSGDEFEVNGTYGIGFVEPASCFEYLELCHLESDNHNNTYITADNQFWCRKGPVELGYSLIVYKYSQEPHSYGEYSFCTMLWDEKRARYYSSNCDLQVGNEANISVVVTMPLINKYDKWEINNLEIGFLLQSVADCRYNYRFIIVVAVLGSLIIVFSIIFGSYWYLKQFLPRLSACRCPADETALFSSNRCEIGYNQLCQPPIRHGINRQAKVSRKREKSFEDELFTSIPPPEIKT